MTGLPVLGSIPAWAGNPWRLLSWGHDDFLPIADAERPDLTDEDLYAMCDATADTLPDGRHVWCCWDGTFLDRDGQPDRSRPIDYKWPTVEEMLAEADARQKSSRGT